MDNEGRRAKAMVKSLPFKEKMKHYWGYYKKHVMVFLVAGIIVIWGVVQCVSVPEYDLKVGWYATTAYKDENTDKFAEYLKKNIDEINGDGEVNTLLIQRVTDITKEVLQPEDSVIFTKLTSEMSADEYKVYVFDQPFMDHFQKVYSDTIQTVIPLHEIPEMKNMLEMDDDDVLYTVIIKEFNRSKDNQEKAAEYDNAVKIEKLLNELHQKSVGSADAGK